MDLRPLDWSCDPLAVVAAWPADRPLMALISGRPHPRWSRWSILASPITIEVTGNDPVGELGRLLDCPARAEPDDRVPFAGGWIGYLGYDLGRHLEPAAQHRDGARDDRGWPVAALGWCPDALLYDNAAGRWYAVGDPPTPTPGPDPGKPGAWRAGALVPAIDPDTYLGMVAAAREYIAAGDIFQANITHRLTAPFEGSTRRLAIDALSLGGAWYGAYLELGGGRCLLSLSPELFVELDPARRRVVTRPVKGTRPASCDPRELLGSTKDAAELTMIVDLMRNDLGRVCEPGSVRVARARRIETHPTVHHGVAEVTGVPAADCRATGLLRAAFPGGSVTGAPKIRAMQVIDELEPVRRGPYCGSIGYVSRCGRTCLNIAIRTLALAGEPLACGALRGLLDYGTGGGIVADSDPVAEYRETMDKAAILRMVLGSTPSDGGASAGRGAAPAAAP